MRTPASDGSYPLANRVLVAGGGGGGGESGVELAGGAGGNADSPGDNGLTATESTATIGGGGGGGAGTTSGPGSGGTAGSASGTASCDPEMSLANGTAGDGGGTGASQGQGGDAPESVGGDGGGGGGGYFGGGGAGGGAGDPFCGVFGSGGGGGGGASFPAADVTGTAAAPDDAPGGEVIITYQLLHITTTSLQDGRVGNAYGQAVSATGGISPYSWSASTGLPPGLSINPATGVISGTPTGPGTFTFTVTVTDAENPAMTASAQLSITIVSPLVITTGGLAAGQVGSAYDQPVAATGGICRGHVVRRRARRALPSIDPATGEISGMPTASGTFFVTVTVTDAETSAQADSVLFAIVVRPLPLAITTTSLAGGQVASAYDQTVAATGGIKPYTWSAAGLPAGLSIDPATGEISGMPTASGTFNSTIAVSDAETLLVTASAQFSIVVKPAPLAITTTSLPAATGGAAYSATLAATGGITPYTWSVSSGSLPPGLTLNPSTGVISGTPDVAGTYDFTVTVTDAENPAMTASQPLSISVSGPVITSLRPASGPTYGDTPVIITGTGLSCPAGVRGCTVTVTFGGHPAAVAFVRPGEIGVISPPGTGTVDVVVTVGGVSSQVTPADRFTYRGFLP